MRVTMPLSINFVELTPLEGITVRTAEGEEIGIISGGEENRTVLTVSAGDWRRSFLIKDGSVSELSEDA